MTQGEDRVTGFSEALTTHVLQGEGMKLFRNRVCSARLLGSAFAALLLATTLAPIGSAAHEGHESGTVIANANGDNVRLRTGPSYEDAEIDRFPEGTPVHIDDGPFTADDGSIWYSVTVEGQAGYMVSDFLAATESGDDAQRVPTGTAVTNDSVFLRSGPSTSDTVVRTLPEGEMVTLTGGDRDGWLSVSATGGDGWVYGTYLASDASATGTRYTIDPVHLRTGPGTDFDSIAYLEIGVQLELTGEEDAGFAKVTSSYGTGWVFAQYIDATAPEQPETPEEPAETGVRYTIDTVHLRSEPTTDSASIAYLEVGVRLELTGEEENGFARVTSSFGTGWVYAQYIGATAPETPPVPEEPETPTTPVARYTTSSVNLRTEASQTSTVVAVIAAGTEVQFSGTSENGYSRVTTAAGDGWIASEFLSETMPETPQEPEPSSSLITWPVSGGEWVISQGYNGGSHQNRSSSWQYYYSLDIKRSDGSTAGQPVYSPVSGTVRWIDEAMGGGSISMGNGLAFAFFHSRLDPSIQEGDTITQGQYLGTVAPAGEAGSGSSAHLHLTIWETSDEGNWSRTAIPFTGNVAIEGANFPADGSSNDWRGYTFNP